MRDVFIVGAHTIKFSKYLSNTIKDLTAWTVDGVLKDASIQKEDLQSAWFSNSGWGMTNWQHCIRGQVALRPLGIESIPITNVENACASGSTAFHGAWKDVASGYCDISMAVGSEKIYAPNKYAVFAGFLSGLDTGDIMEIMARGKDFAPDPSEIPEEQLKAAKQTKKKRKAKSIRSRVRDYWNQFTVFVTLGETLGYDTMRKLAGAGKGDHSAFMDVYAYAARAHMKKYGSTQRQLAAIASKNHYHSTLNPNAQYTFDLSVEDALGDRLVSYPLTRSMCAPIGDGAASAVLASGDVVKRLGVGSRAVKVMASVLVSGRAREWNEADIGERGATLAYECAGVGPQDIDVVELHDATTFGELHQSEVLGFFPKGEGGVAAERGVTRIGGKKPINPSGGLLSRGHPIGASGLAQIHEMTTQLRGEAGKRQVEGARIAMAENGGGALGNEEAALCVHILRTDS